jgi:hypothetical protein
MSVNSIVIPDMSGLNNSISSSYKASNSSQTNNSQVKDIEALDLDASEEESLIDSYNQNKAQEYLNLTENQEITNDILNTVVTGIKNVASSAASYISTLFSYQADMNNASNVYTHYTGIENNDYDIEKIENDTVTIATAGVESLAFSTGISKALTEINNAVEFLGSQMGMEYADNYLRNNTDTTESEIQQLNSSIEEYAVNNLINNSSKAMNNYNAYFATEEGKQLNDLSNVKYDSEKAEEIIQAGYTTEKVGEFAATMATNAIPGLGSIIQIEGDTLMAYGDAITRKAEAGGTFEEVQASGAIAAGVTFAISAGMEALTQGMALRKEWKETSNVSAVSGSLEEISLESDVSMTSLEGVSLESEASMASLEGVSSKYNYNFSSQITIDDIEYIDRLANAYNLDGDEMAIVESIILASKNEKLSDDLRTVLRNFDKIKDVYPGFNIRTVTGSNSYNWCLGGNTTLVSISEELVSGGTETTSSVLFHETGHSLLHQTFGEDGNLALKLTLTDIDTFTLAQHNLELNPDKIVDALRYADSGNQEATKLTFDWYESIRASEEERLVSLIDAAYSSSDRNTLSGMISDGLSWGKIKEILQNSGMEDATIDSIIENPEVLKNIALKQNEIVMMESHLSSLQSDYNAYCDSRKISSMLNSITMSSKRVTSEDGILLYYTYGHSNGYWAKYGEIEKVTLGYDELFADFFSLKVHGRSEALERVKDFMGTELYENLEQKFNTIIENIISALGT